MQKGTGVLVLILILGLIGIIGGVGFYFYSQKNTPTLPFQPEQKACTLEAKICPDGSAVGREGPNCEFKECPASSLHTYQNSEFNFEFKYDDDSFISHDVRQSFDFYSITLENPTLKKENFMDDVAYLHLGILEEDSCDIQIDPKYKIESKTLGDNLFMYTEGTGAYNKYYRRACLVHKEDAYYFSNEVTYPENIDKTKILFEHVLTSFKFNN